MQTTKAPEALEPGAAEKWLAGTTDTTVRQGDLWVLSWDGRVVGHVLIAGVSRAGYILAWPVTLPGQPSFSPGVVLSSSPLGVEVTLWPTLETGLGLHLLDRNLGPLMASEEVKRIAHVMDETVDLGYPERTRNASDDPTEITMVEHWADLCFHTGGLDAAAFLDHEKIAANGRDVEWVCDTLHVEPGDLWDVWLGNAPVPEDWLTALATALEVEPDDLLRDEDPLLDVMVDLTRPAFKADMKSLAEGTAMDEVQARRAVRDAYTLAARDDSAARSRQDQKLRDAIARVRRENGLR